MEAPNFSRTLEPLTVKEHEPATFRVFFSGCPRPEVTWMRYTFPIEDSDNFQGSNSIAKTSAQFFCIKNHQHLLAISFTKKHLITGS